MNSNNNIKSVLKHGQIVFGCIISEIRTPVISMILETVGFDFLILDMEHGNYSYETIEDIILACHKLSIAPIVRIPEIRRECFLKPLDSGASGILIPRVESKRDVELAIKYSKYSPIGDRGLSLRRARSCFKKHNPFSYTQKINEDILLIAQIETQKSLDHLDDILSTPGLDVAFVGPSDLTFSLGSDKSQEQVRQAIMNIVKLGKKHGITTGIHASDPDMIESLTKHGLQMISCNTDTGALINGFTYSMDSIRKRLSKNVPIKLKS